MKIPCWGCWIPAGIHSKSITRVFQLNQEETGCRCATDRRLRTVDGIPDFYVTQGCQPV